LEIFRACFIVEFVDIDNEDFPFVLVKDKVVVAIVESLQILDGNLLLTLTSPLLDILHKMRD
jgi:hypothetical protein